MIVKSQRNYLRLIEKASPTPLSYTRYSLYSIQAPFQESVYGPAKYALPFVRYYLAVTWYNVHYTRYYLPLKLLSITWMSLFTGTM